MCGPLSKILKLADRILVVGCGNSNFSGDLYDAGYEIIKNIDFSSVVIKEMISKNLHRPKMEWKVMDMTDLSLPNQSFDAVLDKGGLDALMSSDCTEVHVKANKFFAEVDRILNPGGKYVCISLAEGYILHSLLTYFNALKWHARLELIPQSPAPPIRPFLIVLTKPFRVGPSGLITVLFDNMGLSLPRAALLDLNSTFERVRMSYHHPPPSCFHTLHCNNRSNSFLKNYSIFGNCDHSYQVQALQNFHQKRSVLASLSPGRFERLELWTDKQSVSSGPPTPRFTITVLDVAEEVVDGTTAQQDQQQFER